MSTREIRRLKKKTDKNKKKPPQEHDKTKKPILMIFSIVILVVIVVTFVGAPVAGKLGKSGLIVFGSYDGKEIQFIPGNYLSRQSEMIAEQVRANSDTDNVQLLAYQVWKTAFQRTVLHTAILKEAEEAGLTITEDRIDLELTKNGPYVVDGTFSPEVYNATSVAERSQTRKLFDEDLIHQQYLKDILQNKHQSSSELEFIKETASIERSVQFIEFTFEDYPEESIIDFAEENNDLFREIKISRITVNSTESDAQNIYNQLQDSPLMFEELAKTQSKDAFAEKGGEMGWKSYHELEPNFNKIEDLEAVFALRSGEISPIIDASFGWVIYRCDEEAKELDLQEPESIEKVASYIQTYEGGIVEDYLLSLADDFKAIALQTNFEAAASDIDKTFSMTDFFPINYGNNFFLTEIKAIGEDKSGILQKASYNEDFFNAAFSLNENQISSPIVVDSTIMVLKILGEREADEDMLKNLDFFFPYVVQQYQEEDLNRFFLSSDKLVNNFDSVFYEYFMP